MPKFLFELALFVRTRLTSFWLQVFADWVIRKTREEYIEYRIIKHKAVSDEIAHVLEFERQRRLMLRGGRIGAESGDGSSSDSRKVP